MNILHCDTFLSLQLSVIAISISQRVLLECRVNICPYQGSRTIRTEEALFIALARFSQYISKNCQNPVSDSKKSKQAKEIVKTEDVEFSDASVSEESSDEDD